MTLQDMKGTMIARWDSKLKTPNRRKSALNVIETNMPSELKNPEKLKTIDKETFKYKIVKNKGKILNCAEDSVINEIYKCIN